MKPKQVITAIVLLVIVGAGALFISTNSGDDSSQNSSPEGQQTSTQATGSDTGESSSSLDDTYPNIDGANIGDTIDAQGQSEVMVSIDDFIFKTTVLTVSKGTKVTWVNEGNVRHDIATSSSSDIQNVSSELLANGESFSYTFDEAGQFDYFCSPHPTQMRGVVIVK